MRRTFLAVIVLLNIASAGWAYTLVSDSTDVGLKDNLLYSAKLKNSGQAEIDWIQGYFNDATISLKQTDFTVNQWQKVDSGDLWALQLFDNPEYFLVKTGNTGTYTHYLFENLEELSWAVISLGDVNITGVVGIDKISHVDEINGAPVPEPATLMLLGAGFLGLAIYGRRRRS